MDRLPTSCSPLSYCSTLIGHTTFSQSSLNYLSSPKDYLPPARFCSHFQHVSRLYIAVLPLWPSSSSPQAGCRRYNPSNAALPSTVRLLPTCSVGTSICLSRTTNLPLSRRLSITASTVSNWRGNHKPHTISTKNNIKGIKLRWKKYDVSMAYNLWIRLLTNMQIQ